MVSPLEVLQAFDKETTYAAAFPCIVCGQLHFSTTVLMAKNVEGFSTVDGLGRFCREEDLADWRFLAHGHLWICKPCKSAVDSGNLPAMALKNNLAPSWADTPANSCLNDLAPKEKAALQEFHPFQQVWICLRWLCLIFVSLR